ncbi:uncharacterized protein PHACADRAFT_214869 [Phanerochaete carnosa HHB-10118-sp]|uniref:Uncharacterized protein n=1 Tax=Phanerochaete carnosa (strain HHB-10118-sp) TaxID=650164 RepID=K5WDN7_PHACS|nr:uncharacterized protein PHACADRAFT_214869 [Phanerochaete carnosa HHB-10118-sp]EKM48282.1 hypothetical protein PHACADRAFT_214869 [Phanerochaete carnosa HHB-10118-sp]
MKRTRDEYEEASSEAHTVQEELEEESVFCVERSKYICQICDPATVRPLTLKMAIKHEETIEHTRRLRIYDGRVPSSDLFVASPAARPTSPLPPSSPIRDPYYTSATPTVVYNVPAALPSSPSTPSQQHCSRQSRLLVSDDDEDPDPDNDSTLEMTPRNPPGQIYDDWGGRLGRRAEQSHMNAHTTVPFTNYPRPYVEDVSDEEDSDGGDGQLENPQFSDPLRPAEHAQDDNYEREEHSSPKNEEWWPWRSQKASVIPAHKSILVD